MVSREIDLVTGVTGTHFSNGNTKFPNAGLNTMGLKVGVIYNFNRPKDALTKPLYQAPIPKFSRYLSYDLTLFGSWRRKGVWVGEGQIASPDAYTVLGFNFAPCITSDINSAQVYHWMVYMMPVPMSTPSRERQ